MSGRLIFVIVLGVSLISAQTVFAGPNLIAHWKLDEGNGSIAYDSAGDNDGYVYGAMWTSGIIGGALDFDGIDDHVSVPDNSSLDISGAITVSAWFKLDVTGGPQCVLGKVVSGAGYSGGGYHLVFSEGTGFSDGTFRLVFKKANGIGGTGSGNYGDNTNWDRVVSEKNDWETGVWYHVAATWDGTTDSNSLKMYINGALNASHTADQSTIRTSNGALQIGRSLWTSPMSQFDGVIDDVRVYNEALSAEEIEELYQEESGGLVAHWKLDEGSGDTAYDSAGDNDGNLVNGPTWTTGLIGGALSLDGVDDYVDLGTNPFEGLTEGTISAWIKPEATDGARCVVGAKEGTDSRDYMSFRILNGNIQLWFRLTSTYLLIGTGGTVLPADTWYHVVYTTDSSGNHLYVNGNPETVTYEIGGPGTNAFFGHLPTGQATSIGILRNYSGANVNSFDGTIDDVRIYDRALSAEEIEELYISEMSAYERAVTSIEDAIAEKTEATEKVNAAMAKEQTARDAISELLRGGDCGDLSKRDLIRALMKVHQAMQSEKQSLHFLDKSVESLEGSLADLGWDPNLVAHWKLDEGSGTIAHDSAGDNDGVLVNGPAWTTGVIGGALSFDGSNDYVGVGTGVMDFSGDTPFAATAWIRAQDIGAQNYFLGTAALTGWYARIGGSNGLDTTSLFFKIDDGTDDAYPVETSTKNIADNAWHFIAVSINGSEMKGYVDCSLEFTVPYSGVGDMSDDLNIGLVHNNAYFNGAIDDVRIYNRALSAEEVKQLYKDGK